jgi:hypothetical protein
MWKTLSHFHVLTLLSTQPYITWPHTTYPSTHHYLRSTHVTMSDHECSQLACYLICQGTSEPDPPWSHCCGTSNLLQQCTRAMRPTFEEQSPLNTSANNGALAQQTVITLARALELGFHNQQIFLMPTTATDIVWVFDNRQVTPTDILGMWVSPPRESRLWPDQWEAIALSKAQAIQESSQGRIPTIMVLSMNSAPPLPEIEHVTRQY